MHPFIELTGIAAPLLRDDVGTDHIAPASDESRRLEPDYARLLFARLRRRPDGSPEHTFVLNQPQFNAARILVSGENFGCGSGRESAVWALTASGVRCIVARSFADAFRENALHNGVLPIVLPSNEAAKFERHVVATDGSAPYRVELRSERIVCPDGREFPFTIAPHERTALLEGLDPIGVTLKYAAAIDAWEAHARQRHGWYYGTEHNEEKDA